MSVISGVKSKCKQYQKKGGKFNFMGIVQKIYAEAAKEAERIAVFNEKLDYDRKYYVLHDNGSGFIQVDEKIPFKKKEPKKTSENKLKAKKGTKSVKTDENISRVKSEFRDYAFNNQLSYFATFTVNANKINRNNLDIIKTALTEFNKQIRKKLRRKYGKSNTEVILSDNYSYLGIFALHEDGKAIHIHALINLPESELTLIKTIKSKNYGDFVLNNIQIYDWKDYSKRFGHCEIIPIRTNEDFQRVVGYIVKNIDKTAKNLPVNKKILVKSNNLRKAIKISEQEKNSLHLSREPTKQYTGKNGVTKCYGVNESR